MGFMKEVLSHTTVLSIILVGLQSLLLPMAKGRWPIFILPTLTLIIGNVMIWSHNDAQNKVTGTFVVIVLAGLLSLMGSVSKARRAVNH
ncbi:hypothetical protein [Weissella confusa]|uniref:hypothetical protein n=1 Tax=Weissella confusa TaxID=1583 RepID=UPI0011002672|nr:hypothetical protein [Weissella confusa]TGE75628.1 hypothetical protein C6P10_07265 [Weissella confusa]